MIAWARKTRGIIRRDTRANQPLASDVLHGTIYYVTDESVTERSNGLIWEDMSDAGGGGVTDHAALTGLGVDDHTQYHNNARGDARYSVLAHTHSGMGDVVGPASATANAVALYDGTTGKLLKSDADLTFDGTILTSTGGYKERGYTVPMGEWITEAFDATAFYGTPPMTWGVTAPMRQTYSYAIVGKTMFLAYGIEGSAIGGTPGAAIKMRIPGGFTHLVTAYHLVPFMSDNAGAGFFGIALTQAGTDNVIFVKDTSFANNWTVNPVGCYVRGGLVFPVN